MNCRTWSTFGIAAMAAMLVAPSLHAQSEESIAAEDGGIHVDGWMGKIDAGEAANGMMLENARLAGSKRMLEVQTGPAVSYWNPANTASGSYTVSATFHEAEYMALNNHPHPYGLFVGGQNLGTDQQSYLYCAAYGNGTFIVRGFGPDAFQVNGRRGEANDAVNSAAGKGQPVTQEIAISVSDDSVSCSINGTVVGTYPKSDVVTSGRLSTTDGVYGLRFGHNTAATVSGLSMGN